MSNEEFEFFLTQAKAGFRAMRKETIDTKLSKLSSSQLEKVYMTLIANDKDFKILKA